jgi:hypothetical protein
LHSAGVALSRRCAQPALPTPRCDRHAITDSRDAADSTLARLANDPMDRIDIADPMLATLRTEPTEPIESAEFVDPMLSTELRER